ncbi:hypothetical protein ACWGIA_08025 [Streptomyces bobili]
MDIARTSPARRNALTRRIRLLVAATITYNGVEAVVAITAGTLALSTVLIGFGLDSVIEVSSAAAVAWQFSADDHAAREAREKTLVYVPLRRAVLVGLVLNATLGWSWADPIAALAIAVIAVKEGREPWQGVIQTGAVLMDGIFGAAPQQL